LFFAIALVRQVFLMVCYLHCQDCKGYTVL